MDNKDEPAFPVEAGSDIFTGITKREYFAAKAMQGILANPVIAKNVTPWYKKLFIVFGVHTDTTIRFGHHSTISSHAVFQAESLLKQLEESKQ